jgi:exodeoxyribonuclease III
MKIATWNVNGLRKRQAELFEWLRRERPAIVCLQEIKATPDLIPTGLWEMERYWSYFHGGKGYSGVGVLVSQDLSPVRPTFSHPAFDHEQRIVVSHIGVGLDVVSVYVPNGGKDFPTKMLFLDELARYAVAARATGTPLVICGDLNVTRTDNDVHPKERKANAIGQRPEERVALSRILDAGLVDVVRQMDPANDQLFTWWAPWRNMRQRNIGWRIDYVLASEALATRASSSIVQREVGTSDHAPVMVEFGEP